jgi:hypothetical protein
MMRRTLFAWVTACAGAIALGAACGPAGFESSTVIDSVRILATRADNDKSFAHPGDTVTVEALVVDGRKSKSPPAVLYWLPFVCTNPTDDLYYACFAPLLGEDAGITGGAGGSDGGTPGTDASAGDAGDAGAADDSGDASTATPTPIVSPSELAGLLTPGTDITPFLSTGPFTFVVPTNIIATHPPVAGTGPYGLVVLFNIACTGRVKTVALDPAGGPQQVPLGCFDDAGNALGADQYVIGFTREFVYPPPKTNTNPQIDGILFNGVETKTNVGSSAIPSPVNVTVPACDSSCSGIPIDLDVPSSSWTPLHKSIWVDYYAMKGGLGSEARLLYDVSAGQTSDSANRVVYTPTPSAGPDTLWAVVHDSNEGVTWLEVDITAK